mgnify:CR=1 FL=1
MRTSREIALGGELREMCADLARVVEKQRLRVGFVGRFERFQYASSGAFASTTTCLPPGSRTMTSGRMPAVVGAGDRLLLLEIAVLDHAGQLDDAFAAEARPSGRGRQGA